MAAELQPCFSISVEGAGTKFLTRLLQFFSSAEFSLPELKVKEVKY